ncbi:hypothetical protein BGW42_005820 [Actinomortierella wolfii]|nr:hypothetical protein BGW42_005820 [Actinomortierella wolfii]
MEVVRENFQRELPWIREAIYECDFVAIDAEFSGLHITQNRRNATKTLEQSYWELKTAATQFLTVQIGLATFKFDPSTGQYVAKPFNFYIFPTTLAGFAPPNRCFLTEASSLDFLAKNRFNFNKWIGEGIHYMTKEEENNYKAEKLRQLSNNMEDIPVDEQNRAWLEEAMLRITKWLADNSGIPIIYIPVSTTYQRRLIYQEVRSRWPNQLEARGKERVIAIVKSSPAQMEKQQQQRLADLEKDLKIAGGFRVVIDMLSESKKPIVGHNIVIDLAYILAQFVGPLPHTIDEYKQMIHANFPTVIDTKYLSTTASDLKGFVFDSSLQGLGDVILGSDFAQPRIVLHYRHPNYHRNGHEHEAGYDAYMTGSIFIKLMAFIARKERARLLAAAKAATPFVPAFARTNTETNSNSSRERSRPRTPLSNDGATLSMTSPRSYNNNSNNYNKNYNTQTGRGRQTYNSGAGSSNATATLTESTHTAAASAKPVPTPPAATQPAKLSYAAMLNRAVHASKTDSSPAQSAPAPATASTPSSSSSAAANTHLQGTTTSMDTTALAKEIAAIDAQRVSEDDIQSSTSSEDSEFVHSPEPEVVCDPPFTLQSSIVAQFENFLHWGRSAHGNLSLVPR